MAAAEAAREVAMRPGMVEVIMDVIAARVMANPFPIGVDVGRVGVTGLIVIVLGRRMRGAHRSGPVRGNARGRDAVPRL
jgi:hypothetical protein